MDEEVNGVETGVAGTRETTRWRCVLSSEILPARKATLFLSTVHLNKIPVSF